MKHATVFAISMFLGGCFFDSGGVPHDGGIERDPGKVTHLQPHQDGGGNADGGRAVLLDGAAGAPAEDDDAGDARMAPPDAAITLADADAPDADAPAPGTDAAADASVTNTPDTGAPSGEGMTCAPCSDDVDCADGYHCRAEGRCLIMPSSTVHCVDIDSSLSALSDGSGTSNWCLPSYQIAVKHMSVDEACADWLAP